MLCSVQLSALGGVPLLALRKEMSNTLPNEKVCVLLCTYMYCTLYTELLCNESAFDSLVRSPCH